MLAAVTMVALVVGFRVVVRSARFAQTSCIEKQQTTAKIDMIDIW